MYKENSQIQQKKITYVQQIFCEPIARMMKAAIFKILSLPRLLSNETYSWRRWRHVCRHSKLLTSLTSCIVDVEFAIFPAWKKLADRV
jgi:hypothetical protein